MSLARRRPASRPARAAGAILLVLLVLTQPLAAGGEAELRAAVAPAQTVVDAVAKLTHEAVTESRYDGTPDRAIALRTRLLAFTANLDDERMLPERATYREAALAALPYAVNLTGTVATVPEDAAALATTLPSCNKGPISETLYAQAMQAWFRLNATATALRAHVTDAPEGLQTSGLERSIAALEDWLTSTRTLPECTYVDPETGKARTDWTPNYLTLTLQPDSTWPATQVRATGSTSHAGPIQLDLPTLGITANIPVAHGRFAHTFRVPLEAPIGTHRATAVAGDVAANATLEVTKAPTRLSVQGPSAVQTNQAVTLTVRLESPFPSVTDNATLRVDGAPVTDLVLAEGRGQLTLRTPNATTMLEVTLHYPGTRVLEPATARIRIEVLGTMPVSSETAPTFSPSSSPALWLLILLVTALSLVAFALDRWRRGRTTDRNEENGTGPGIPLARSPASADLDASRFGGVALFAHVTAFLRRRGLIPAGATARDAAARLDQWGMDARSLVPEFERVRYGGAPEKAAWTERARAWFRSAWERLKGGEPA